MPDEIDAAAAFIDQFTSEDVEHYGVKGQKWGVTRQGSASVSVSRPGSASVSISNPRAEKRAHYKADLKSGRANAKLGKDLTEAEVKAMSTNAKRKILGTLAAYGAVQVASYAVSNGAANRLLASAQANGTRAANESLKQIGDLSTFVLRPNGAGVWG